MMLETKKYNLWDYMCLSMKIAPVYTILRMTERCISALLPSIKVVATAAFVDNALAVLGGTGTQRALWLSLLFLIGLMVYGYVDTVLMTFINWKYNLAMERALRTAVIEKRARLQYRYVEDNETWELLQRVGSNPGGTVGEGQYNLMEIAADFIQAGSLLLLVITQVWWAGLIILAVSVPMAYLAIRSGREMYRTNKEGQKHYRRLAYFQGILSGRDSVEERSLFSYTEALNRKWTEKYELFRTISLKAEGRRMAWTRGSGLVSTFVAGGISAGLLFPLQDGAITPGTFIGLITSTFQLVQRMCWQLTWHLSSLSRLQEYLKDLTAFCALSEQEDVLELPGDRAPVFETLEFRHVTFTYPGTYKEILKDFCLTLKQGLHYAFVGVNGAGKTTVTKLLTGLYTNYEGEILLNGRELRTYSPADLKALFSVVYQDFAKYYIPVRESIGLGDVRHMDACAVKKAVDTIGLAGTVEKLPQGLDTWLGKIKTDGTDLSGGEWQRVAIARSLVSPAQIRILDEPTAALDPVAESRVYETFGRISQGKSTIFITNRLGAAKLADVIVVIDGGRAAEQGSHRELMDRGGLYAAMFDSQRSWYQ